MDRKNIVYRDQWVFRRDRWQCQMPECLCPDGTAIDPNLYRDHDSPWAPTVDHIIPRSRGGPGRRENLRAAHRLCNNEYKNSEHPDLPIVRSSQSARKTAEVFTNPG